MGIHDNTYRGMACVGMVIVFGKGGNNRLQSRVDLKNYAEGSTTHHGTDSFDWGCDEPECYQLGLSILAHEYGDEFALKHAEKFTEQYVCGLNEEENWELNSDDLDKLTFVLAANLS